MNSPAKVRAFIISYRYRKIDIIAEEWMTVLIDVLKAIFYGILFGVTEWLPVSSEAHVFMAQSILPIQTAADSAFMTLFVNVLRIAACLACAAVFFNRIWPFTRRKSDAKKKAILRVWLMVFAASLPLIAVTWLMKDKFHNILSSPLTAGIMLIGIGALMLCSGKFTKKPEQFAVKDVSFKTAVMTGCAQVLSLIPGTSRSAVAMMAGRMSGLDRYTSGEFACFLAIPALLSTAVFKLSGLTIQWSLPVVLLLAAGACSCVLTSMYVIHSLLNYLRTGGVRLFGYYRIVLGLMMLIQSLLDLFPEGLELLV